MEKELLFGEEVRDIEILEFTAGGNSYGVDINDVREILPNEYPITKIPKAHRNIAGIIMPRDFLIPIVDVTKGLRLMEEDEAENRMVIVSSIEDLNIAFLVNDVVGMHRTNTGNFSLPGKTLTTSISDVVVGILHVEGKKIEVLDLKILIYDINPDMYLG